MINHKPSRGLTIGNILTRIGDIPGNKKNRSDDILSMRHSLLTLRHTCRYLMQPGGGMGDGIDFLSYKISRE